MFALFVGASRALTLAGPLATSVARVGGRIDTVTRTAPPTTAVDGSETAWTRGAGAPAAAVATTRARSATTRMETSREERAISPYLWRFRLFLSRIPAQALR